MLSLAESLWQDKQLLIGTIVCFIVCFAIMWVIGGSFLDVVHGKNSLLPAQFYASLDNLHNVPVIGWFLPFSPWSSVMYFLAPICGFVLAFILIRWWNEYFETKEASTIIFPILIFIVLLVGYAINLSIYTGEAANLNSRNGVSYSLYFCVAETTNDACSQTVGRINQQLVTQAQSNNATTVPQMIPVAFWYELRRSIFFLFVLGAIAAWIPLFVKEMVAKYGNKSE